MRKQDDIVRQYVRQVLLEFSPCRYEGIVIKTLHASGIGGRLKRAACSDALRPDADMKIDGEIHYVEVKANDKAQMGGGSIGYSVADKTFYPTGMNRDLSETLSSVLNDINDSSLHRGMKELVSFLSRKAKREFDGFPMSGFSPEAWAQCVDKGFLQLTNRTVEGSMDTIVQHYARKGTHYIQIGGAGFFCLGDANPAGLPVPKLDGKVKLEVRVAKAGDEGRSTSKAGVRVQARLMARNSSPYTLDDPQSVKKMLAAKR